MMVRVLRHWRVGFDIEPRVAGFAPLIGILVGGVGVAINSALDDGDLRVGVFPWTLTFAMGCLGACSLGLLRVHGPSPTGALVVGAWWTTLAVWAIGGFFMAVAIGALIGLDEEDAGIAVMPPLLGMMFGVLSIAPAMATLAMGMSRARVLPRWSRFAAWAAAPAVPLLLLLGITEGAVETIGSSALMALFGAAWITMGISITRHRRDATNKQSHHHG
ncbi:MAG: hypothetical protein ACR2HM_04115 [Acidimicrobiales bacterium]